MKKVVPVLIAAVFFLISVVAFAEGPMHLPKGANKDANKHNEEGIKHYGMGHFEVALGHFEVALGHFEVATKADASNGEVHFNKAISLDKLGNHGDAIKHFGKAKINAHGNKAILESKILNAHLGMD